MNPVAAAKTLLVQKERAVRFLKGLHGKLKMKKRGRKEPRSSSNTLRDCTCSHDFSRDVDDWPGGYIFLYWIIVAGPKWLQRIGKEELEVSFVYFSCVKVF